MGSKEINIVAYINPKPGSSPEKLARLEKILKETGEAVKKLEPNCHAYQVFMADPRKGKDGTVKGQAQVIVVERYSDKASFQAHAKSSHFAAMSKQLAQEDLVAGPPEVKFVRAVGGFLSRL